MLALIRPIGTLKSYVGGQNEVTVEAGRTVREAIAALGIPPEIVALVMVNEEQQPKDYVLQDGDAVRLLAVIGGGGPIPGVKNVMAKGGETMRVLAARPQLCVGCRLCEQTCAETFYKVIDRDRSPIRIAILSREQDAVIEFCNQCGECIAVCPTQALYRAKNGIVRLKKQDCTGCMACVGFCPTLTMYVAVDDTVPFKCIACAKCLESCPTDALYMTEVDVPAPVTELTRSIRLKTGEVSHGH